MNKTATGLIKLAKQLRKSLDQLQFSSPVNWVYNPLQYAWPAHKMYLQKFARPKTRVFFLGMNPGPWGMAQTGVPFGEIDSVKSYLQIDTKVGKPVLEHPKRPI